MLFSMFQERSDNQWANRRCSEPGHRVQVTIERLRGRVAELGR